MNALSPPGNYRAWFWALAILGLLADLITKYAAYYLVVPGTEQTAFTGFLTLIVSPLPYDMLNTGALGGFGRQFTDNSNWILAGVSAVAIAVICLWSMRASFAASRYVCIAVGFLLAGAAGNLYDRLRFHGVRDFLQLWYGDKQFQLSYVFNLADFWLICGAVMLLLQALFTGTEEEKSKVETPPPVAAPSAAPPAPVEANG